MPMPIVEKLENYTDGILKSLAKKRDIFDTLYTNTKLEVHSASKVDVKLNLYLNIKCWKILALYGKVLKTLYVPINPEDYKRVSSFYEQLAWHGKTSKEKERLYKEKHFISSLFANVKYFYAATSHRLQGSTIDNVFVINSDISKNPCFVEQAKCRYVACSRTKENLYFYRGVSL
jgi:hypothetical protein